MYSNYSEENYCGSLKEEKMGSKLMTRIKETETKIFEKLKSTDLLQMALQDSNKKLNEKKTIILKDTNGIKHSERMENCSEYNYIGPISPLTLPPDIYATKLFSQHEKQISCIDSVILEPLMLPEKLRHTASAIGQLDEILSENCGEDISNKEKIVYVSLKIMEEVNVDRKKLSRKTMIF